MPADIDETRKDDEAPCTGKRLKQEKRPSQCAISSWSCLTFEQLNNSDLAADTIVWADDGKVWQTCR